MEQALSFWSKWRVFVIGATTSAVFALQELLSKPQEDQQVQVYLFAAFMAILSYVASQWRGQGVTITGVIGAIAYSFVTLYQTGNFTWGQFALSVLVAILAAVSPPPKPVTYETNKQIVDAKEVPPIEQVVDNTTLPKRP